MLSDEHLTEIIHDEATIFERLRSEDVWRLNDILLLVFGYEYKDVNWDYILEGTNIFPMRQYGAVLEAFNNPKEKLYPVKVQEHEGFEPTFYVKKGTFFKWAKKRWPNNFRVKEMFRIYNKYKGLNIKTAPSLETPHSKIYDYGRQYQIDAFKKHCQQNPCDTYKVKKTAIVAAAMKNVPFNPPKSKATYSSYIGNLLSVQELKQISDGE